MSSKIWIVLIILVVLIIGLYLWGGKLNNTANLSAVSTLIDEEEPTAEVGGVSYDLCMRRARDNYEGCLGGPPDGESDCWRHPICCTVYSYEIWRCKRSVSIPT